MSGTFLDSRQSVLRSAANMAGTAANTGIDQVLIAHDGTIAKLFEDRNALLTDGGIITFTGTQVQFTDNLYLTVNQKISGAAPQVVSLGSASQNFVNSGDMLIAVLNRTAGTAALSVVTSGSSLPAVSSANQEVFLIAKRIDAADGTQRLYFRNGSAFNAGQSARLGSAGSGSGSGVGDDLDSLLYNASFTDSFADLPTASTTSVDTTAGKTQSSLYSPINKYYGLSYDAGKTVTGTGTSMTMSSAPAYTVAIGDILCVGTEARRITAVASQTSYTIESAFTVIPAPTANACTVSQAVYTKDINNFAVDGVAISSAYTDSLSSVLVLYNDTSSGTLTNVTDPALIGFTASADGTNYTTIQVRESVPSITSQATTLATSGTNLYLRFFANKTSGSGTVFLVGYKAFFHQVSAVESGGIINQAVCYSNGANTPVNCTVQTVAGKTTITTNFSMPVGLNSTTTNGAVWVFVDGKKVERFLTGTTPTSGEGFYTEVNANTIALDGDYSSFPYRIEILVIVSVVDSNTQNTTNIAYMNQHMFKNALINSAFDYWQRGTLVNTSTGTSAYGADRWYCTNTSGGTGQIDQLTGVVPGSRWGLGLVYGGSNTSSGLSLNQVIENINSLPFYGQTASFGVWVKSSGLTNQCTLTVSYATSETKTVGGVLATQNFTVNNTSFTYCAITGINIGTAMTTSGCLQVSIAVGTASSGNAYATGNAIIIEQAMFNLGGAVAPYARAGFSTAEELLLCQRYYEKTFDVTTAPVQNGGAVGSLSASCFTTNAQFTTVWQFKASKRATPTVTTYSPNAASANWSTNATTPTAAVVNIGVSNVQINGTTSSTAGNGYNIHASADAEI